MKKRVLLTGASGFIGSHVLRHFYIETDWDIVCPSTFKHKGIQDRVRVALDGFENPYKRVKVINCDLSSPISKITSKEFGKIDYVINVASESHVDRSIKYPSDFIINNISLMCNLLDWAVLSQPKKFLHFSTDEVYGSSSSINGHKEWKDIHRPSNPYSASKAAQEDIAYAYWRTFNVPVGIVNSMNVIGETQDIEKFVPMTIKKILNNETIKIHSSSNEEIGSRFYIHARNVASALLHILDKDFLQYGQIDDPLKFHIPGDKEMNNLEMAKAIAEIIEKPLNYELVNYNVIRPGYDVRYSLDGMALKYSGWSPKMSFEESLEKTVRWTVQNKEWVM